MAWLIGLGLDLSYGHVHDFGLNALATSSIGNTEKLRFPKRQPSGIRNFCINLRVSAQEWFDICSSAGLSESRSVYNTFVDGLQLYSTTTTFCALARSSSGLVRIYEFFLVS